MDLRELTLIGFSTGGGEVARYIGRHGTDRVARAALVSAVPPLMVKTDDNPGGGPVEVFDGPRAGSLADRVPALPRPRRRAVLRHQPSRGISISPRQHRLLDGSNAQFAGGEHGGAFTGTSTHQGPWVGDQHEV